MRSFLTVTLLSLMLAPPAMASTAAQLLAQDFRAAKLQFKQEKRFYNYFNLRKNTNPAILQNTQERQRLIKDQITYSTEKFWSPLATITGMHAGEGLYLAIDPMISMEYGNLLIEFKVKPNTYYLDLKKGVHISKATVQAIYKEGHKTLYPGDEIPESMRFSEMTLNSMLTAENQKYRALIQNALKAENIMLLEYNWKSDLETICDRGSSTSAFVYIGTDKQLPEFSSVQLVDIREKYAISNLTNREALAKYDTQNILRLMNYGSKRGVTLEAKEKAGTSVFGSLAIWRNIKSSLFGCP